MQELIKIQKSFNANSRQSLYGQLYDNFAFRLEVVYSNKELYSENEIDYANHIDYFQYHYSRYLCGLCKHGHRAFEEFRDFKNSQLFKEEDYNILIAEIETFLLEREMYESLSLFVKTNKKFKKEIQNAKHPNF